MADLRILDILMRLKDGVSNKAGPIQKAFSGIAEEITRLSGAAQMVGEMGKAVWDFSKDVAKLDQSRGLFDNLTSSIGGSDAAMAALREATHGMVSDATLMDNANQMLMMGLVDTKDAAAKMTEMAVTLGTAMGRDATEAMESWNLMMANTSIPRLDTFGISAGKVRNRVNELMESIEGMTREQAFQIAVLEEGQIALDKVGDVSETAMGQMAQMEATTQNLSDSFKLAMGPAIEEVTGRLNDFMIGISNAFAIQEHYNQAADNTAWIVSQLKDQYPELTSKLNKWEIAVNQGYMSARMYTEQVRELGREHEITSEAVSTAATMTNDEANAIENADSWLRQFNEAQRIAQEEHDKQQGAIDRQVEALDRLANRLEIARQREEELAGLYRSAVIDQQAVSDEIDRMSDRYEDGEEIGVTSMARQIEKVVELAGKMEEMGGSFPMEELEDFQGDIATLETLITEMDVSPAAAQALLDWLAEAKRKADALAEAAASAGEAVGNIPSGPTTTLPGEQGWQQYGGVIPGPIGSPQRVIAHGGEIFFNPHQGPPNAYNTTFNINMPAAMTNEQILELQRREAQRRSGWRG